jgi:hypothetical protein
MGTALKPKEKGANRDNDNSEASPCSLNHPVSPPSFFRHEALINSSSIPALESHESADYVSREPNCSNVSEKPWPRHQQQDEPVSRKT